MRRGTPSRKRAPGAPRALRDGIARRTTCRRGPPPGSAPAIVGARDGRRARRRRRSCARNRHSRRSRGRVPVAALVELAPAHVRHRRGRARVERATRAGHQAEQRRPAVLLARSNSNCMPRQMPSIGWRSSASTRSRPRSRIRAIAKPGGADAGQDQPRRRLRRSPGSPSARARCAEPLERQRDRADIAVAEVDDGELAHSMPLVDGKRPAVARRPAWRSARPNALKQASTL